MKYLDAGTEDLIRYVLEDIKYIWDQEGFGTDERVMEPLYARLQAAIRTLTPAAPSASPRGTRPQGR
jgi:hypothetical protein